MIHFGKPFLEANGAIVAGIALGSLSMKTKSIYQGFFVHITVAGLMDWLALWHRHALPTVFWPPGNWLNVGHADASFVDPPRRRRPSRFSSSFSGGFALRCPSGKGGARRARRSAKPEGADRSVSHAAGPGAGPLRRGRPHEPRGRWRLERRRASTCAPCAPIPSRPPSWAAAVTGLAARPRALESLLWRHLAQAPWTSDSREATQSGSRRAARSPRGPPQKRDPRPSARKRRATRSSSKVTCGAAGLLAPLPSELRLGRPFHAAAVLTVLSIAVLPAVAHAGHLHVHGGRRHRPFHEHAGGRQALPPLHQGKRLGGQARRRAGRRPGPARAITTSADTAATTTGSARPQPSTRSPIRSSGPSSGAKATTTRERSASPGRAA